MAVMTASARRWETVTGLTAVVSLVVVLIFNTLQVKQTRDATQLGLLTQLNDSVAQAAYDLDMTQPVQEICYAARLNLDAAEVASVRKSLAFYDYIAWLIRREHVSLRSAEATWARRLGYGYQLGRRALPDRVLARDFPELTRLGRQADYRVELCD